MKTNKMKPKQLLVSLFIALLILAFGFIIMNYFNPIADEIRNRENNYVVIDRSSNLNIVARKIFNHRGVCAIEISDSKGVFIEHSRNYKYDEPWLDRFIKAGDNLIKKADSDTLWIKRGDDRYYFVIGEFINEK